MRAFSLLLAKKQNVAHCHKKAVQFLMKNILRRKGTSCVVNFFHKLRKGSTISNMSENMNQG